jgi:hypothetical protein
VQNICDLQACSIAVVIHAKEADDSFGFKPPVFFAKAFSAGIFLAIVTIHEQHDEGFVFDLGVVHTFMTPIEVEV